MKAVITVTAGTDIKHGHSQCRNEVRLPRILTLLVLDSHTPGSDEQEFLNVFPGELIFYAVSTNNAVA
jgi:hypothetical protein